MENNVAAVVSVEQKCPAVKVHGPMCMELTNLLDIITSILPALEAARPGGKIGIQELCLLSTAVKKGKLIIRHCAECSKLYLAITGGAIVSRCERIKNSLCKSLSQIRSMVPLLLASQVDQTLEYLRSAKFVLDPVEDKAGKAILELLRRTDSIEELESETFQIAASKLNLTSAKEILIERRSVKKLLDQVRGTDSKKEGILEFFLYLLKKYGKKGMPDAGDLIGKRNGENECLVPRSCSSSSVNNSEMCTELTDQHETRIDKSRASAPPEEFRCRISSRIMSDPVVIASGQTYERSSIEKWFSQGHCTCPETEKRLDNLSMVQNLSMKDLISKWCRENNIELPEPCPLSTSGASCLSEPPYSNSISSLTNISVALLANKSVYYGFRSDHSSVSELSSDASTSSFSQMFAWSIDYQKHQSFFGFNRDMYIRFFDALLELPVELQCKNLEDVKTLIEEDDKTCYEMLANDFPEALFGFLKSSRSDVQSQKIGAQLFLAILNNQSVEILPLSEDFMQSLTSLVHSEIAKEVLMVLCMLSHISTCKPKLVASGVAPYIIENLSSEDTKIIEMSMEILSELSYHNDIISAIISSGCIATLSSFLSEEERPAECSLKILRNLCNVEEGTALIAETNGCIASLVELLDDGSREAQEYVVSILYSLCCFNSGNCLLLLNEGVIPALVDLSVNGKDEAQGTSLKLLQLLRDLRHSDCFNGPCLEKPEPDPDPPEDSTGRSVNKQPTSKSSRFSEKRTKLLSKFRSLAIF